MTLMDFPYRLSFATVSDYVGELAPNGGLLLNSVGSTVSTDLAEKLHSTQVDHGTNKHAKFH